MNRAHAGEIMREFASTHTEHGFGTGFYDAEFNIKIRHNWNSKLTDRQRKEIDKIEFDVYASELDSFVDGLKQDEKLIVDWFQEGRTGGWLVLRFNAPENGNEAIKLAWAVKRIAKKVNETVEYTSSDEFWLEFIKVGKGARSSQETLKSVLFDMGEHAAFFHRINENGMIYESSAYSFEDNSRNMSMIERLEELGYQRYPYGNVMHCIMVHPSINI
jgi:hypothetical protein